MTCRAVTIEQLSRCVFFSLEIYGKNCGRMRDLIARDETAVRNALNGVTFDFRTRVRSNHIYRLKTLFEIFKHRVDRRYVIRFKRYISGKTKTVVTRIYTVRVTSRPRLRYCGAVRVDDEKKRTLNIFPIR